MSFCGNFTCPVWASATMRTVRNGEQSVPIKDRGDGPCFGIKGSRRGLPLIGTFNENLGDYSYQSRLPWLLNIHTRFSETFANGFPKKSESASLTAWENCLIDTVEGECQFAWVGHVTWNGFREVFFHIDEPKLVSAALTQLAGQESSRSFIFGVELDRQWKRVGIYFKRGRFAGLSAGG